MAILMLRHTQPDIAPGICYGQLDLGVVATFEQEADAALAQLPKIDRIFSSPLQRCHKLAEYVGARLSLGIEIDLRLKEMDFGTWEGVAWSAIPRPELDAWANDFFEARPHGGETVTELKARTDAVLAAAFDPAQTTLLVTHAGIIRSAMATSRDPKQFQTEVPYGGLIRLPHPEESQP